jgi:hypothetical protein
VLYQNIQNTQGTLNSQVMQNTQVAQNSMVIQNPQNIPNNQNTQFLEKLVRCKVCMKLTKPEEVLQHAWNEHKMSMAKYYNFLMDLVTV